MRNQYTPFFNMPDCYSQYRAEGQTMPITVYPNLNPKFNTNVSPGHSHSMTQNQGQMQMQMQDQQDQGQTQSPATSPLSPITPTTEPQALTITSVEYLNGFLRTQIGKMIRIEFLIGTGTLIDRTGTLLSVGANYITIRQVQTDDVVACDFFSIKFINFLL